MLQVSFSLEQNQKVILVLHAELLLCPRRNDMYVLIEYSILPSYFVILVSNQLDIGTEPGSQRLGLIQSIRKSAILKSGIGKSTCQVHSLPQSRCVYIYIYIKLYAIGKQYTAGFCRRPVGLRL